MKIAANIHAVTAVFLWLFVIFSGTGVLKEGGLAAAGTLFIMVVATSIAAIDMLAVFFAKKQKSSIFSIASIVFWTMIYLIYLRALLSPRALFDSKLLYGSIVTIAILKIIVSAFMIKFKEDLQ